MFHQRKALTKKGRRAPFNYDSGFLTVTNPRKMDHQNDTETKYQERSLA